MPFCSILLLLFPENGSVGGSGGISDPQSQAEILQLLVAGGAPLLPAIPPTPAPVAQGHPPGWTSTVQENRVAVGKTNC